MAVLGHRAHNFYFSWKKKGIGFVPIKKKVVGVPQKKIRVCSQLKKWKSSKVKKKKKVLWIEIKKKEKKTLFNFNFMKKKKKRIKIDEK